MDEFTRQCFIQNQIDFKAGRISSKTYAMSLVSIAKNKSGGYINYNI